MLIAGITEKVIPVFFEHDFSGKHIFKNLGIFAWPLFNRHPIILFFN